MQANQTPTLVPLAFAAGGAFNTIPEASQIGTNPGGASLVDGFPPLTRTPIAAGGIPPSGLDMNGVLNLITQSTRWAHGGGRYAFNSAFAADTNVGGYPAGAMLMSTDGQGTWLSLVDNNSDNPDTGPGTKWAPSQAYGFSAISGLTNVNVTLTPAQAMKSRIVLTGALTGNVQIILPTWTREWTIVNNTTGAFTITVKTASGTGVAIPAGAARVVCDGTNVTQPAESIASATLASHALTAGQIGAIGSQGNLPINTSAKVNGVNAPNLLFNGSGEFGASGWVMAPGPAFSLQIDQTGGIGSFFANASAMSNASGYIGSPLAPIGQNVSVTESIDVANFATAGTLVLTLAAYNSSGAFISNVASLTVPNGTPLQRYTLSGTTPTGTFNVQAYWTYTGVSASAFGIAIRRVKIEQGSTASLYSQEASVAAIGTSTLAPARVRLTQNTNFYVNASTGSDSNNGTTSTSAWATITKALTVLQQNYDLAGYTATVNVAAGSYAPGVVTGSFVGAIASNSVQIVAAGAVTVTNPSGGTPGCFYATGGAQFAISGSFTLVNNNSGASCAQASGSGSILNVGAGLTVGFSAGSHFLANADGVMNINANYAIANNGGAGSHYNVANAGILSIASGITVTVGTGVGITLAFAAANGLSQITTSGVTYSGSAVTGTRYISNTNSVISTNGGGANYFPGSTAGSTSTGGQYL
ncbi:beta strand repeat-containing protein [Burkholderia cenocepacia]|uniref:beta strand repeat-containing protein n=1 Tax=Burkholderia cenocepacia TaxID=95486 RepID=UPI001B936AAF|nr:hypothetical protein [Burkholderia cenocepacia]MBR8426977.1 hypothetical protein [Burkholderia cenocepacia]